ncbi:MAG: FixH family protein [Gammaproteobacteria bacterium]|nr:FixH family protein [Gammaproteobacteria bacterium]
MALNDAIASTPAVAPWYRHPIVWLIIAIPGAAVVMGMVLLTLAIRIPESVVRDDYYQAGRAINIDLRATHRAAELGITATLIGSPEDGWLMEVRQRRGELAAETLEGLLAHPTQARKDVEFGLARTQQGWSGLIGPTAGRHVLSIRSATDNWLLRKEVVLQAADDDSIEVRALPWGASP